MSDRVSFRAAALVAALFAALLLGGCSNIPYLDAKARTRSGGELDQQQAAAQSDLDQQRQRHTGLSDAKTKRDAEIARDNRRIAALDKDLKAQDRQLAAALKAQRVDQARYNDLKRQLDALQADTETARQDQARAAASPDGPGDTAKAAKLAELEQRKKSLEEALGALTTR